MSPREKQIPDSAHRTSICLTAEERAAVRWISEVRRATGNKRTTTNAVLIDALWYFLEKTEGKTKDQIGAMVPAIPRTEALQRNVTTMPRPRSKR